MGVSLPFPVLGALDGGLVELLEGGHVGPGGQGPLGNHNSCLHLLESLALPIPVLSMSLLGDSDRRLSFLHPWYWQNHVSTSETEVTSSQDLGRTPHKWMLLSLIIAPPKVGGHLNNSF